MEISIKRVSCLSSLGFIAALALACASGGCVTVEGDVHDDCDDGDTTVVVVTPPDETDPPEVPTEQARVDMVFNGLTTLTRDVGEQDIPVFCFTAVATVDTEVRKLRMHIADIGEATPAGGLVDTSASIANPNFTDIKVMNGIQVVAGPRDVLTTGDDIYQPVDFTDVFVLEAHRPVALCVYLDVADNAALDGDEVQIQLGSPMLGDMVRLDDGAPILVEDIHPNTGMVGQFTALVADETAGPIVPMAAPVVSYATIPSVILTNGTVVAHRATFTARTEADVLIGKMSFLVTPNTANAVSVGNPRLRIVGQGAALPAVSSVRASGGDCDSLYPLDLCMSIVLDDVLYIPAGTSVTVELLLDVDGTLAPGDMLTTGMTRDAVAHQEGVLVGTGLATSIKDGDEDDVLWSNDGLWFYNGRSMAGTPFAVTMTRL